MASISFQNTIKAIGEFQNLNSWNIQFQLNPNMGVQLPDNVLFRCQSVGAPTITRNQKSATINGFEIKQPGWEARGGEIDFKFPESERADLHNLFDAINKAHYAQTDSDVTGSSKGWENLKSTVFLYLLNSKGKRTQGYKLMDAELLPVPFDGAEFGSEDGVLMGTIKVRYNWWAWLKV